MPAQSALSATAVPPDRSPLGWLILLPLGCLALAQTLLAWTGVTPVSGRKNMAVTSVPIRVNPELRPSRLVRSLPDYVFRSAVTILRSFATYKPLRFFVGVGLLLFAGGFALGLRYVYFAALGEGEGHIQSVILCALLLGMGVFTGLIGIVADLITVNRRLLEKLLTLQHAGAAESAAPRSATRRRAPPAAAADAASWS